MKLYTNYDGAHHGFGTVSVSDTNNGNLNLFSSFAALNSAGTAMTVMVINKDPSNAAQVTFNLSGFSASTYVAYYAGLDRFRCDFGLQFGSMELFAELCALQHYFAA